MIVETDDFFCHQTVQPHAFVSSNDRSWADRAYFTIADPARFGIDVGISMYPNGDTIEAYSIAAVPGTQWSMRAARDLSAGRFPLWAGPVRADIVEPLKRWTLTCEENDSGISYEMTFTARSAPYEIAQPPIRKRNRLIHHDAYMFQPGKVDGVLRLGERTFDLDGVGAHRDRTWGFRAAGEGQLPHGVLAWMSCDFEDVSLVVHLRDRGDDMPQIRDGAVFHDDGTVVPLTRFEHELEFDHDTRQCLGGTITVTDERGGVWPVEIEPTMRVHLSGAGYTSLPDRRGRLGVPFWSERWDLTDAELVGRVEGLNDNISVMRCGDRVGTGTLETSIGEHVRYSVSKPTVWA